ncbi:MAG: hypothetical protein V2I33_20265, partial [Kangiellaceae bacterium]|nr:hypothetical protein [Kangiellaceae bacterium]
IVCGFIFYAYNSHKETGQMFDAIAIRAARLFRHKLAKYLSFLIGLGLVNFCMFIQTSFYASVRNDFNAWTTTQSALFIGGDRILFSIGISCMMMPVLLGKLKLLFEFMAARFWIPFARLSYCVYLMHVLVVSTYYNSQ